MVTGKGLPMTSSVYHTSDSDSSKTFSIPQILITLDGLTFDICWITSQCISVIVEDSQTQVRGDAALVKFLSEYLEPVEIDASEIALYVRHEAVVSAAEARTTDHLIKIAAPALIDVTTCISCGESISDGEMCDTCASKQAEALGVAAP